MKTLTQKALYALLATTLLSACSRPYATFQKTTPEHFYTQKAATTPAIEAPSVAASSVTETPTVAETAPVAAEAPTTIAAAQTQLNDLVASNKTGLATNKKLATRLNRVQHLLATTSEKQALSPAKTTAKMGLMAKLVTKRINKQIEKKLAPDQPKTQSAIRLGIIVGIIGLLLLIIGNGFFGGLGGVLLVIGLLGILLGYLDVL